MRERRMTNVAKQLNLSESQVGGVINTVMCVYVSCWEEGERG